MERFGLRNDQWDRIKDVLPGREGHVGGTAEDNRLFVEAVLYRFRTGCPWRDLPQRFGDFKTVHQRFGRWAKSGVSLLSLYPVDRNGADDRLSALIDMHMLNPHELRAAASEPP
jgi:hypothetical protein